MIFKEKHQWTPFLINDPLYYYLCVEDSAALSGKL